MGGPELKQSETYIARSQLVSQTWCPRHQRHFRRPINASNSEVRQSHFTNQNDKVLLQYNYSLMLCSITREANTYHLFKRGIRNSHHQSRLPPTQPSTQQVRQIQENKMLNFPNSPKSIPPHFTVRRQAIARFQIGVRSQIYSTQFT